MWSKESIMSIPCPGSLFPQSVIAKVVANLEHLDDQERKRRRPWNNKEHLKNKRMKKVGKQEEKKEEERIVWIKRTYTESRIDSTMFYNILQLIWI